MALPRARAVCWVPLWNAAHPREGLEQAVVADGRARSDLLAIDDDGRPFGLAYTVAWDDRGRIRQADLAVRHGVEQRALHLRADGEGRWHDASGAGLPHLDGCIDVDIWPTPLTNSLPIWRSGLAIGERRVYRMAWIAAPLLTVEAKPQAYTRLAERLYRFESLDDSGFRAELTVDDDGLVVDYPGLFARVGDG